MNEYTKEQMEFDRDQGKYALEMYRVYKPICFQPQLAIACIKQMRWFK